MSEQKKDTAPDPTQLTQACYAEIVEVLGRHSCQIIATLAAEQVGQGVLRKLQIESQWAVQLVAKPT